MHLRGKMQSEIKTGRYIKEEKREREVYVEKDMGIGGNMQSEIKRGILRRRCRWKERDVEYDICMRICRWKERVRREMNDLQQDIERS